MRTFALVLLGLVMFAGCQCCSCSDRYYGLVDDISDCNPQFDRYYHAPHDVTRIGKPDWYQSGINRKLFPRCRHCCR